MDRIRKCDMCGYNLTKNLSIWIKEMNKLYGPSVSFPLNVQGEYGERFNNDEGYLPCPYIDPYTNKHS